MRRLRISYLLADILASIDSEVVQLTQETVYFFIVIFLIELHFWNNAALTASLAGVLFVGSTIRYLNFLAVLYLFKSIGYLSADKKIELLAAHERRSERDIQTILEQMDLRSAKHLAARLAGLSISRFERLTRQ